MAPEKWSLRVVSLLLLQFLLCKGDEQIEIVPSSDIVSPLGQVLQFNCTQKTDGALLGWNVFLSSGNSSFISQRTATNFTSIGIDVYYLSQSESVLQFNGSHDRLKSVSCRFGSSITGEFISSTEVQIFIISPPSKPADIRTTLDNNSLTIDWNYPNTSRKTLEFIVSLRTALVEKRVIVNDTQSYKLILEMTEDCQSLEADVTAMNIAGTNSAHVQRVIPPLPTDLCYQMNLTNNGPVLHVSFKLPKCSNEVFAKYQLEVAVINSSESVPENITEVNCKPMATTEYKCRSDFLPGNSSFNFAVRASTTGLIGHRYTQPITTSSRNIPEVSLEQSGGNITLTCYFLSGSSVQGCRYEFLGDKLSCNISGTILRGSKQYASTPIVAPEVVNCTEVVISEIFDNITEPSTSYNYIVSNLFEVERNNVNCLSGTISSSGQASTDDLIANTGPESNKVMVIVIVTLSVGFLLLVLFTSAILMVPFYLGKKCKLFKKERQSSVHGVEVPAESVYNTLSTIKRNEYEKSGLSTDEIYSKLHLPPETPLYHVLECNRPRCGVDGDSLSPYEIITPIDRRTHEPHPS